ncbi:MAG: nuclear transport factor 2 family protein [Haliea sp.]|nr:MAG: nuclear transport factor 2 family protein [Haliea sp.]
MPTPSSDKPLDLQALLQRIDRLESRHQIAELVGNYARACDEHDIDTLCAIFTEDGVIDSPANLLAANGRQGIRETFGKRYKIRGPSYHWTHDHKVVFDEADPDHATGLVLGHAETCPDKIVSIAAMRYADDYRREGGVWRFSRRTLTFLYYVPVTDYPSVLATPLRLAVGGQRLPGDYPESLDSWKKVLAA